jgi:hypothetical protein
MCKYMSLAFHSHPIHTHTQTHNPQQCGACTVLAIYTDVLGKQVTGSINACLAPLSKMDGWSITTTEGIGGVSQEQVRACVHVCMCTCVTTLKTVHILVDRSTVCVYIHICIMCVCVCVLLSTGRQPDSAGHGEQSCHPVWILLPRIRDVHVLAAADGAEPDPTGTYAHVHTHCPTLM